MPQQNLKVLLSESPAFQALCHVGDAAGALEHIHLGGLPDPLDFREYSPAEIAAFRPFIIINLARSNGYRAGHTAMGSSGFQYHESGRLEIQLERASPPPRRSVNEPGDAMDRYDADVDFQNVIGAIIEDMRELSASAGKFAMDEIVITDGPFRNSEESWVAQGDFQFVFLEVAWGGSGIGGGG